MKAVKGNIPYMSGSEKGYELLAVAVVRKAIDDYARTKFDCELEDIEDFFLNEKRLWSWVKTDGERLLEYAKAKRKRRLMLKVETPKPGDEVLVRESTTGKWIAKTFLKRLKNRRYVMTDGTDWKVCKLRG